MKSRDVNLDKITIFYCLKCVSKCINEFNVLKNPRGTSIIQAYPLKSAYPTIPHWISRKIKWKKLLEKSQEVERLDYVVSKCGSLMVVVFPFKREFCWVLCLSVHVPIPILAPRLLRSSMVVRHWYEGLHSI
jgi:hypothetical protein